MPEMLPLADGYCSDTDVNTALPWLVPETDACYLLLSRADMCCSPCTMQWLGCGLPRNMVRVRQIRNAELDQGVEKQVEP